MEGWTEQEFQNRDLMAPCGLYCGTCGVYIARREGNEKFRSALAKLYGTTPEETVCDGCMQSDPGKKLYSYCRSCEIRSCVQGKGFYSCHQCQEWPCERIVNFPLATGLRVMKRTIPIWRAKVAEAGDEAGSVAWAGLNASAIIARTAANPYFAGLNAAVSARQIWRTAWTVPSREGRQEKKKNDINIKYLLPFIKKPVIRLRNQGFL